MAVDVSVSIEIDRRRAEVAAYAMDPSTATTWYKNITAVKPTTPGPLAPGYKAAFEARFLGRILSYTYEVVEFDRGRLLVMRSSDSPFPMETTYLFGDTASGGTAMTLCNRGEPTGFGRWMGPIMAPSIRRANRQDLRRLKAILEGGPR